MNAVVKQTFFIAGTDTDVGKTVVSAALLQAAKQQKNLATLAIKPIAAGCEQTPDGLRNEDALTLSKWASVKLDYQQINPITLKAAVSPHIAAARENKNLSADRVVGYCRGAMMNRFDLCLVEGAGGWLAPIGPRETMADIAKGLGQPVILVVGIRLGCLNHALLTAQAIQRDGLKIAAWVANIVDVDMLAVEENIATLQRMLPAPMLGVIPYMSEVSIDEAAQHIDINKLLNTV
ncbi:dethiobiotin synthase [Agarilytica rhodophyticola]|uniref:dethiobiotin synthase n=1 Tax=Agarilytica rhodophyticola TaxID=1737490 RepID=UPI000B3444FE|nr:dethiobiotin synthase [Agarilytica rhodophyticola]